MRHVLFAIAVAAALMGFRAFSAPVEPRDWRACKHGPVACERLAIAACAGGVKDACGR